MTSKKIVLAAFALSLVCSGPVLATGATPKAEKSEKSEAAAIKRNAATIKRCRAMSAARMAKSSVCAAAIKSNKKMAKEEMMDKKEK